MNLATPNPLQLDALREVANIGCGHAASALSQLVGGRRVQIDVPRVLVTPLSEVTDLVGGADAQVVAASLEVEGEMGGKMLLVLPEQDAHRLCAMLLGASRGKGGLLQEPERSALSEVANIVASACLSAIGTLAGLRLIPSVPHIAQDSAGAVVDELWTGDEATAVVLEARFVVSAATPPVTGQILMLPDFSSVAVLLQRLGL